MEIEKKFLVTGMPDDLDKYKKKEIEQGYLNRRPVVRIRKSNDDYILTYKGGVKKECDSNSTICSNEIEAALTKEAFYHLLTKIDGHAVEKTRYIIPLGTVRDNCPGLDAQDTDEDGNSSLDAELKIEFDVFHGRLEGLYYAEVEFPTVAAAESFRKPDWFGDDVSMDKRYRNGHLADIDSLADF